MIKSNIPKKLPIKLNYSKFAIELAEASFELGKLDGLQRKLPNPSLLISPLTVKEATVSSKIEGTKSTVSDVMRYEAGEEPKYPDTVEVVNYRKAILWAMDNLDNRKLNLSFVKELHSILLNNVRGHGKRGDFRDDQVFIGKQGDTIEQATYIPPAPLKIPECMENFETYLLRHKENPLIKSAIIHYQFEAIHPFGDGNGRIGRLIIPLYLYQNSVLYQPILYLSGYFEAHRGEYVARLHDVDLTQEYETWAKFFLVAVKVQAKETQKLIEDINELMNNTELKLESVQSPYVSKTVRYIFMKPIFKSSDFAKFLKVGRATANRLINRLQEKNILFSAGSSSERKRLFVFKNLIDLL